MTASALATTSSAVAQDDFKPFVCVDLIDVDLGGETVFDDAIGGETLDVNAIGEACGYIILDDASDTHQPFYFDPTTASLEELPIPSGYEHGHANGLNYNSSGEPMIVGVIYDGTVGNDPQAVYWEWDGGSGAWDDPVLFLSSTYDNSEAFAVNDSELIVGWYDDGSDYTSFRYEVDASPTLVKMHNGYVGTAYDIDSSGNVVGQYTIYDSGEQEYQEHAYFWANQNSTLYEVHCTSGDWSGARAINENGNIVGWRWPSGASHRPVYWHWDENTPPTWTSADIIAPPVVIDAIGLGLNVHEEGAISYTTGLHIDGGHLSVLLSATPTVGAYALQNLVELIDYEPDPADPTATLDDLNAINDNGWIAGSYDPDDSGTTYQSMPALFIPYNCDNNYDAYDDPIPDYREIIANGGPGSGLDAGGREWLLDRAEQMRVGLHAAGGGTLMAPDVDYGPIPNDEVHYTTIVRLMSDQNELEDIVDDVDDACSAAAGRFDYWGTLTLGQQYEPKEIIISVRTVDSGSVDYVPTGSTRTNILSDVFQFSNLFADCIDYMQFGNEIWAGAGAFSLEISGCNNGDQTPWKDYEDNDCLEEGGDQIFGWLAAQIKASRAGSALAGRPLRYIAPASYLELTVKASGGTLDQDGRPDDPTDPNDRKLYFMNRLIDFANTYDIPVDQHLHYTIVDNDSASRPGAVQAIETLMDAQKWPEPELVSALEWGPMLYLDGDWWTANYEDVFMFYEDGNSSYCDDPSNKFASWEEVILGNQQYDGWEDGQFDGDFELDYLLASYLYANGFSQVCYGPHSQRTWCTAYDEQDPPSSDFSDIKFDVAALRASHIRDSLIDDTGKWSPLRDYLETAIDDNYDIDDFDPHADGCSCD